MFGKLIILMIIIFESTLPASSITQTLKLSYTTCIGERDHFRSNGKRLNKAADMLQQDRANYHRYRIRDAQDGYDSFFSKRKNRSKMGTLLKNGYITPELAHGMVTGNPLVQVDLYARYIRVTDVSNGSNCAEDENFKYSGETPIGLSDTFQGIFQNEKQMKEATLNYLHQIGSMHNFGFSRLASEYGRLKMKQGIIGVYDIPVSNHTHKLVAAWSSTIRHNDCHGCVPALSFFEFAHKEDGWHMIHSYVGVLSAGNWGRSPKFKDIELIELGRDRYAIKVETRFATMGWGSRGTDILLPSGAMIYQVFGLQIENNNIGSGGSKKTDWHISLNIDKRSQSPLYDILTTQKGWKEGKEIFNKTRYVYSQRMYRYIPEAEAKRLAKEDKRTKVLKDSNLLVKNIAFPSTIDKVVDILGLPDKTILPVTNKSSPEGQWFVWNINGTLLKILGDDYSSRTVNWKAKTRGGLIECNKSIISSIYGVVVGADGYFNVRKKVLKYIEQNSIKNYDLVATHTFSEDNLSYFIRFKDPKTGLFVLFYFKYGKLVKVYQGTFDITLAG